MRRRGISPPTRSAFDAPSSLTLAAIVWLLCIPHTAASCSATDFQLVERSECNFHNQRVVGFESLNASCAAPDDFNLDCSWVPLPSRYGTSVALLVSLGLCVNLFIFCKIFRRRKHPIMRASQPMLCLGFVAGALLMTLAPTAYVSENTTTSCIARVWLLYFPPTIMVAFLFAKVFRALVVFERAAALKRTSKSHSLHGWLRAGIAASILTMFALLLVYSVEFTPEAVTKSYQSGSCDSAPLPVEYCDPDSCSVTEVVCEDRNGEVMRYVCAGFLFVLVVAGCIISYFARHIPDCFGEAEKVGVAMYMTPIFGGVTLFMINSSRKSGQHGTKALLIGCLYVFISVTAMVVLFVPKLKLMDNLTYKEAEEEIKEQLKSHSMYGRRRSSLQASRTRRGSSTSSAPPTSSDLQRKEEEIKQLRQRLYRLQSSVTAPPNGDSGKEDPRSAKHISLEKKREGPSDGDEDSAVYTSCRDISQV